MTPYIQFNRVCRTGVYGGGGVSADVIWGKNIKKGEEKKGKMHDKKEEGEKAKK